MRHEIEHENVVLVLLQSRNQSQQFVLARFIAVAKNDRRRTAKTREKPAFAMPAWARHLKLHRLRTAWKTLQVNLGNAAVRLDDAINQESRNRESGQSGKKYYRDDRREQLRVPL